jgi:hypothetical protein
MFIGNGNFLHQIFMENYSSKKLILPLKIFSYLLSAQIHCGVRMKRKNCETFFFTAAITAEELHNYRDLPNTETITCREILTNINSFSVALKKITREE